MSIANWLCAWSSFNVTNSLLTWWFLFDFFSFVLAATFFTVYCHNSLFFQKRQKNKWECLFSSEPMRGIHSFIKKILASTYFTVFCHNSLIFLKKAHEVVCSQVNRYIYAHFDNLIWCSTIIPISIYCQGLIHCNKYFFEYLCLYKHARLCRNLISIFTFQKISWARCGIWLYWFLILPSFLLWYHFFLLILYPFYINFVFMLNIHICLGLCFKSKSQYFSHVERPPIEREREKKNGIT